MPSRILRMLANTFSLQQAINFTQGKWYTEACFIAYDYVIILAQLPINIVGLLNDI